MVNPQGLTAEERLFALQERFGEALLENPGLVETLPENFVLAVLPLDDPEAARLAMESLPRLLDRFPAPSPGVSTPPRAFPPPMDSGVGDTHHQVVLGGVAIPPRGQPPTGPAWVGESRMR